MISGDKKHRKHGKTKLAPFGTFGRFEIAILGTPCPEIKNMVKSLAPLLGPDKKTAYIEADHKGDQENKNEFLNVGINIVLTDKISHARIEHGKMPDQFHQKVLLNDTDLVFVNGNHFEAKKQIAFIDERKPLEKKLDRLTDVIAFVVPSLDTEIPSYLNPIIGEKAIPIILASEPQLLADLIISELEAVRPELYALVLAGGKSVRMGKDKGLIDYHGVPQREFVYKQLEGIGLSTFISCRGDQKEEIEQAGYKALADSFLDLGPFGAILSAFREYPDKAWLVLACDLPLLQIGTIQHLIRERDFSKGATAFQNPTTNFPDPLITIWEPKSYLSLLEFLALGYSCPRKVLINSDIHLLEAEKPDELLNANSPEDVEKIMPKIQGL